MCVRTIEQELSINIYNFCDAEIIYEYINNLTRNIINNTYMIYLGNTIKILKIFKREATPAYYFVLLSLFMHNRMSNMIIQSVH